MEWIYMIRMYGKRGELVCETRHKTEMSKWVEEQAVHERLRNGTLMKAEIIDLRPGGTTQILH